LIVVHAGTRSEGLIDGCDLVFLVKSKDGEQTSIDFQTTQERQHYSSPGDSHHPLI
jgi:hypothetical protein